MAITEDRPSAASRFVPFAVSSPFHVTAERYYDREFYELEKQYLWPRTWQMACRLEEIPEPGDWVEYEICDQSIVVVRQADRSVKAFYNTCPHRGTQLCKGAGRAPAGQLVCPFHGWRWNIDGSNSLVYGAEGFQPECVRPEAVRLTECKVDMWGACVWINMDPEARPLRGHLSPAAAHLDACGVDNMRVWWWKELILNANWKVAQEAFFEGYHVAQTHPQLTMGAGMDYPPDGAEYLTVDVVRGDWPVGLPDDDVLALPATAHYRLLQRVHDPGTGQLSTILGRMSQAGREAIRHPHPEVVQLLDPRPLLDEAASIGARYHTGGLRVTETLAAGLAHRRRLWFGTEANVGRRLAEIAADLGIEIHVVRT